MFSHEIEGALDYLRKAPGDKSIEWIGEYGNIFVRNEYANENPKELLADATHREALFADLFDDIKEAYKHSRLVSIIRRHQPDVIIDSINTATAISYQNLYTASNLARKQINEMIESVRTSDLRCALDKTEQTNLALYELLEPIVARTDTTCLIVE